MNRIIHSSYVQLKLKIKKITIPLTITSKNVKYLGKIMVMWMAFIIKATNIAARNWNLK